MMTGQTPLPPEANSKTPPGDDTLWHAPFHQKPLSYRQTGYKYLGGLTHLTWVRIYQVGTSPVKVVPDHGSSLLRGTREDVPWLGTFGGSSLPLMILAGPSQLPGNLADSRIPLGNLASLFLWQTLDDRALP